MGVKSVNDPMRVVFQIVRVCCCLWLVGVLGGCAGLFSGAFRVLETDEGRQVVEALRQKEERISSLRGLFQADVSAAGVPISQSLQGMFAYSRPDSLRLKGFARLGLPFLDFQRRGNDYSLSFPQEGRTIKGQLDAIAEPNQWDQTVRLSLQALDGVLNKLEEVNPTLTQVWKSADQYRIDVYLPAKGTTSHKNSVLVRRWVDVHTLEIQSIEYFSSFDELIISVECEDYRTVKDRVTQAMSPVRLPFSVRATDHRPTGGSIKMNVQEYVMNAV